MFLKDGMDFWAKLDPSLISSYEKGEVISNYNAVSEFDHLNVFTSLTRIFHEIIREDLLKRQIPIGTIKECFNIIDTSFKVLSTQIETELKINSPDERNPLDGVDVNTLIAGVHGYINSYVERQSNS